MPLVLCLLTLRRHGYPVCSESQQNQRTAILSPIVQQELLSLQDDGFPIMAFGNDALVGLLSYLDNPIAKVLRDALYYTINLQLVSAQYERVEHF